MKTVYTTLDIPQSLIIRLALKDAGIQFFVPNENASSWVSDVGNPAVPFEFQVKEEDFDAAKKAIREALDRIRETPKPDGGRKKGP